jgi:molybdate transport system substrate-binding protein
MPAIRAILFSLLILAWPAQADSLTVAVAANVKYAFDDLAAAFTKESGIEVKSVSASSGKIVSQVRSGAPFDVFMSADMEFPEGLYKDGYASAAPKTYAYGALVLWTRKPIDLKGLATLTDPTVTKVAIANPKVAPYGREAIRALEFYKLRGAVEPKLVYGESISQVSQYVDIGAADVGITAKSIVVAPETAGRGKWVDVPAESYDPIAQGAVILKHGTESNAEVSRRFFAFLFSPSARAIFQKYGYTLP